MSPEGVDVRPARLGEEQRVLAMYEWLFEPPGVRPDGFREDVALVAIAEAITLREAEILVATLRDRHVGLCSIYLDLNSVRFGRRAWVEDLAVDPEYRSRGVGRALLEAAQRWGIAHRATHLELDSGIDRTEAHRFYERERPSWRSNQYTWVLER